MFGGRYSGERNIKQRFLARKQKYRELLLKVFEEDLKRLKTLPGTGRGIIEDYKSMTKRFDLKLTRQYRFV